jgi:hypothetical protein
MSDKPPFIKRVVGRIIALLPEDWQGDAGKIFQETVKGMSDYNRDHVRLGERFDEAPDVAWNTLKVKSSEALLNAATTEQKQVEITLAQRTISAKVRQEEATAEKMESEARISRMNEIDAKMKLARRLQELKMLPLYDQQGNLHVVPAPDDFDWQAFLKYITAHMDRGLGWYDGRVAEPPLTKSEERMLENEAERIRIDVDRKKREQLLREIIERETADLRSIGGSKKQERNEGDPST